MYFSQSPLYSELHVLKRIMFETRMSIGWQRVVSLDLKLGDKTHLDLSWVSHREGVGGAFYPCIILLILSDLYHHHHPQYDDWHSY